MLKYWALLNSYVLCIRRKSIAVLDCWWHNIFLEQDEINQQSGEEIKDKCSKQQPPSPSWTTGSPSKMLSAGVLPPIKEKGKGVLGLKVLKGWQLFLLVLFLEQSGKDIKDKWIQQYPPLFRSTTGNPIKERGKGWLGLRVLFGWHDLLFWTLALLTCRWFTSSSLHFSFIGWQVCIASTPARRLTAQCTEFQNITLQSQELKTQLPEYYNSVHCQHTSKALHCMEPKLQTQLHTRRVAQTQLHRVVQIQLQQAKKCKPTAPSFAWESKLKGLLCRAVL